MIDLSFCMRQMWLIVFCHSNETLVFWGLQKLKNNTCVIKCEWKMVKSSIETISETVDNEKDTAVELDHALSVAGKY